MEPSAQRHGHATALRTCRSRSREGHEEVTGGSIRARWGHMKVTLGARGGQAKVTQKRGEVVTVQGGEEA
eukprot:3780172-Rhodomonas_salina.1